MTNIEITCIIIGFIGMLFNVNGENKAEGKFAVIAYFISKIISKLIFGAMILLPLYFNYWR